MSPMLTNIVVVTVVFYMEHPVEPPGVKIKTV
jgi:hypothetical protein